MAPRQTRPAAYVCGAGVLLSLWAWAAAPALAQSGACVLSPDRRNPNQRILRCGSELTITAAPGTVYRPAAAGDDGLPASVQLDSGALLIEFNSKKRHELQILTPQAVASVRGTKWAMEVKPGQTSTLVLAGEVTVARKNDPEKVVVGPGQGVDISGLGTPRSMYGEPEPWIRLSPARAYDPIGGPRLFKAVDDDNAQRTNRRRIIIVTVFTAVLVDVKPKLFGHDLLPFG
jgi:ferric-dicitrate binding protein FerR (iron transport regulator)